MDGQKMRIGYWMTEKKFKRIRFKLFIELCRNSGIECVELDLEKDLDSQGPFDLILHKLTDHFVKTVEDGCVNVLQMFQDYCSSHKDDVLIIDPISSVFKLFDRNAQYKLAEECQKIEIDGTYPFFIPSFVELKSRDSLEDDVMTKFHLCFPIVCKSSISVHLNMDNLPKNIQHPDEMMIVMNEDGLREDVNFPCVLQNFINHDAKLFKVFVVGDRHFVVARPSIKNLYANENAKTIHFRSSDISKSNSTSYLNVMDENQKTDVVVVVDEGRIGSLVACLRLRLGLDLFGVDVIVENATGRYAIIDINPFPGYDGVMDFPSVLLEFIRRKLTIFKHHHHHQQQHHQQQHHHHQQQHHHHQQQLHHHHQQQHRPIEISQNLSNVLSLNSSSASNEVFCVSSSSSSSPPPNIIPSLPSSTVTSSSPTMTSSPS
ncbi:hypothetical protein HELRODRAFT_194518 [Helobdella robusta]|uniref:Inositol-tetrakisphosphate 1-kinase n=1 Tax=Helobdella robusta TaxID=6412 RepID=T1FW55_HELRO|nr:hypothetical protein HELRODRAFT_194518 [Helobdella robusta]ESN91186.1 hypothetical protein HELRODRAFT_194518 [Helobdella robusta]